MRQAYDWNGQILGDDDDLPFRVADFELNARDGCKNFNAEWRNSYPHQAIFFQEQLSIQT
jgi:hypothetical protein